MQTYEIPRNYKGESRILYIFSVKALAYTGIGVVIGGVFYFEIVRTTNDWNRNSYFLRIIRILRWNI